MLDLTPLLADMNSQRRVSAPGYHPSSSGAPRRRYQPYRSKVHGEERSVLRGVHTAESAVDNVPAPAFTIFATETVIRKGPKVHFAPGV